MIGAIAGDIIGSCFEFDNHRSIEFELFTPQCDFTDDTVMTIAVADAIMNGLPFGETMHKYGRMYRHRGYGGRFNGWLQSNHPTPYDSFGNGSAMRVSPCAFLARGDRERALTLAASSAVCTHNHPEGIKGALAIADAILMAFDHQPKEDIRRRIERLYGYELGFSIEQLRPTYQFDETCQGSVPQAIVAFLEGDNYESVVRLAVSLGGDSDTIACMAGGIAEAYYGVPDAITQQVKSILPVEMWQVVEQMYSMA